MCLGIPGRVVEIVDGFAGQLALVDVQGAERRVNIGMLEEQPDPGAWVLIHMGFALEVIDEAQARTALSGLQLMGSGGATRVRRRFGVTGLVQGVGFRPFVYVTASQLGLAGSVANTPSGVVVEVEGGPDAVHVFGRRLVEDAPPMAQVEGVREDDLPTQGGTGFTIRHSDGGDGRTLASPDVATCDDCLAELRDPTDRRYRHPFLTCTNCGPRFTIITSLPYDRARTTMAGFEMCAACRAEYDDPADRRFHAQPIACPDCGPTLELVSAAAAVTGARGATGESALTGARRVLASGGIVAVKGLGGYHLACDARNERAVAELRRRKQRGDKPFAVMVRDPETARRLATIRDDELSLLTGTRRPIVLVEKGDAPPGDPGVAPSVAPGCPDLGLMLPYTPLHVLLVEEPGPDALVMTSGNVSGEPIVTDDDAAIRRLESLADAWLRHDRPIHVPCDDSVSRVVGGVELPLRRSRGHAPLPVALPFEIEPTLAVGADLKNTCALGEGRYAWVSQHIGDMDDLATGDALTRTETHLEQLTGVVPRQLVRDDHPGYRSGRWAADHAAGRPVTSVQHHHAHIASVMAEHGLDRDERCIGIAFDGTGYGTDGAVWGGEVLVCDYKSFRRTGHLGYVPMAGGDASVRRPYRMALAHLYAARIGWTDDLPAVAACPGRERGVLEHQLTSGLGCVPTSSVGRLFDAVASLSGVRHLVEYEAQAAIELEGLARAATWRKFSRRYRFRVSDHGDGPARASAAPVIRAVVSDVRAGASRADIAIRFHDAVAELAVELAGIARSRHGLDVVALGGGVFANAWLLGATQQRLEERGFTVLRPRLLPPNDGGLALGQLLVAAST